MSKSNYSHVLNAEPQTSLDVRGEQRGEIGEAAVDEIRQQRQRRLVSLLTTAVAVVFVIVIGTSYLPQ